MSNIGGTMTGFPLLRYLEHILKMDTMPKLRRSIRVTTFAA
jgi:hypothetical protein